MLVKICGITRLADAMAASEAGASAIGFVFWPSSPRFVDPHRARAIAAALPAFVASVGVFVDQPVEYVSAVARLVGLSAVQLHGAETRAYAMGVARPVIKAVTLADDWAAKDDEWPSSTILLVDAIDPVKRGGTGKTTDWAAAAALAARRKVLLAGGLTPDNVAEAVGQVRPFGIDVSSGVERSPGVKDHKRIKALFDALGQRLWQ